MDEASWLEVHDTSSFDQFRHRLETTVRPPIVAVTRSDDPLRMAPDVKELAHELRGVAELYVLKPYATYWLTDYLGSKILSVYMGWTRVYPASQSWRTRPWEAPSFRPAPHGRDHLVESIVETVFQVAFREGHARGPAVVSGGEEVVATVQGVMSAGRVLVDVEKHGQAVMHSDHLHPALPAERLVLRGQRFTGSWRDVGTMGEFIPDAAAERADNRIIRFVGEGIVTLGFVESVSDHAVRVLLHPQVGLTIPVDGDGDARLLASPGHIVTLEVIQLDGQLVGTFSNEAPIPAVAVFDGGPPWLVNPEDEVAMSASSPEPSAPEELILPSGVEVHAEVDAFEDELTRAKTQVAEAQRRILQLQRALRDSSQAAWPVVYTDRERQFRFELELAYLTGVDEASRGEYPWPREFRIGPQFLVTLESLVRGGGISRRKVLDVCVDVLSNRARHRPSLCVKPWLNGRNGSVETRRDGAVAMRVRLQNASSAARRLKYWHMENGVVELDQVCVHDGGLTGR